jgi:hypothetical protein
MEEGWVIVLCDILHLKITQNTFDLERKRGNSLLNGKMSRKGRINHRSGRPFVKGSTNLS